MKYYIPGIKLIVPIVLCSWTAGNIYWLKKDCRSYTLNYTTGDTSLIDEYQKLIVVGLKNVERFFGGHYKNKFDVFILLLLWFH